MRRNSGIAVGILVIMVVALAGCGAAAAPAQTTGSAPAAASAGNSTPAAASADYTSAALPASYDNAAPASTQLALGILRLEGTPQAVTQAQAKSMLPLWQAFQGNALQNETEQNAVLRQIEGALSADQVKAIAAMHLTNDDMRTWMDEHGMQGALPGSGTPGAPGGAQGNLTDAQRQALRATAQAGGGAGGGAFGNMTDAQRQAFRATAEANGGQFFQGGQGGQGGQPRAANGTPGPGGRGGQFRTFAAYRIFVAPIVEMLTARAAQ